MTGLCPGKGIKLDGGGEYKPSKFQIGVWRMWENFWDKVVPLVTNGAGKIAVVHNGDSIDGNHHQAVDLIPNVHSQEAAAIEIFKPIKEQYPDFYMVRGTEAHEQSSSQSCEKIASEIGAVPDPETGSHSFWQLWLKTEDVLFQLAHHIGTTSSAAYETSAPMRELIAAMVEAEQWKQPMPKVFVRSHRHRFVPVSLPSINGRIHLIITPAWQLRTPHVERIDRMRMPHIGGVIFLIEGDQCEVHEKIYPLPGPKPIRL
jgi:hypothetical protein